jgi:AcrR family transcriptional regulator
MISEALALVDEGGLPALTVDALAERASTSNGAIYHRFGSRGDLLLATMDEFLGAFEADVLEAVETLDEDDDVAAVTRLVSEFLSAYDRHRLRFRAFMIDGRKQEKLAARGIRASHHVAEHICAWLVRRFDCRTDAAHSCFQLLFGLASARTLWDGDEMTFDPPPLSEVCRAAGRAVLAVVTQA